MCPSENKPISDELLAAYKATSFEAITPVGLIKIHIDAKHPSLDSLLTELRNKAWAFITAHNPHSKELTITDNAQRHLMLMKDITGNGFTAFEGAGIPNNSDWSPETSALILGISLDDAKKLGMKYGQNAIVTGELGCEARLIETV
jgi:hypothetical protein